VIVLLLLLLLAIPVLLVVLVVLLARRARTRGSADERIEAYTEWENEYWGRDPAQSIAAPFLTTPATEWRTPRV
jgi:inner membrane protein involved in colicin E2 resistance